MFKLANIYGPSRDETDFFQFCFDKIHSPSQANLLINGDFSIILDDELDKYGGPAHTNRKARKIILHTCNDLILEILSRQSPLGGVLIDNVEYQTSLFADDTLIFLKGKPSDFELALLCIETFGAMSVCKMNWSKSTAFYIGSLRERNLRPIADKDRAWSPDVINYLRIKYLIAGHLQQQQQIFELNFGNNLVRIKTIINI